MARRQAQVVLSEQESFVLKAIDACKAVNIELGHPERYGMHVVFSGFNAEFERRYGMESRSTTDAMVAKGLIGLRPARGGVTLFRPQDAPAPKASDKVKSAIAAL